MQQLHLAARQMASAGSPARCSVPEVGQDAVVVRGIGAVDRDGSQQSRVLRVARSPGARINRMRGLAEKM